MVGIRMFCLALGWAFGALLFGTETTWLFGIQSFIWCGFAGGTIGILLTTKQKQLALLGGELEEICNWIHFGVSDYKPAHFMRSQ